jgi:1-acyl-sn-glycerol-3-phosphate acyltransferase
VRQIRLAWRLPLLVGLLLGGLATVLLLFPLGGPGFRRAAIGRWSRMLVAACGIEVAYREHPGAGPLTGLAGGSFIVSNHISWMDIFIIDSQCPASFVAKAEIAAWPLVGTLVARTGNLFIERGKRHAVHRMIERIVHSLAAGARVAVFPEGTTSDGRRLLPFHANLVEAAVRARAPVVPVGLRYLDRSGEPSRAIEFIGETTFVQSLLAVLAEPGIRCEVHVLAPITEPGLRRHDIVERARAALSQCLALPLDDSLPENLRELRRR